MKEADDQITLRRCLARADELAQDVFDAWRSQQAKAKKGDPAAAELKSVFEKAYCYHNVKREADSHRRFGCVTPELEDQEQKARLDFVKAYMRRKAREKV